MISGEVRHLCVCRCMYFTLLFLCSLCLAALLQCCFAGLLKVGVVALVRYVVSTLEGGGRGKGQARKPGNKNQEAGWFEDSF